MPLFCAPSGEYTVMPKNRRASPLKVLYFVCALGGWALFLVEWVRVSSQTAQSEALILIIVLALSLLLIHLGTHTWIGHNRRIAAKGKRGSMTRYASPDFSRDSLGRLMVIDSAVYQSQEILISIDGETKVYGPTQVPEVTLR